MRYRPEIDGLRAIAVLLVIFFHLGASVVGGGFIGVDVFFVISGYLITAQLQSMTLDNGFGSFVAAFYRRRIRRLAPALIVMLAVSYVFAYLTLDAEQMNDYATALIAQPFSLQNFVFLAQGQYFVGSAYKPLLHTWSLAVEEQFYFIWPFLVFLTRRQHWNLRLLLVVIVTVSFALNIVALGISPKVSFFMSPPRFWELAIGGLIAARGAGRNGGVSEGAQRAVLAWAGIALIFAGAWLVPSGNQYPGYWALIPTLGSALFIIFAQSASVLCQIMASPPMAYVGRLSYSLYLWHWPAIVYAKLLGLTGVAFYVTVGIVVGTASIASYHLVEQPVRRRYWAARDLHLLTGAARLCTALVLVGAGALSTDGALFRYSAAARPFLAAPFLARSDRCGLVFRALHPTEQVCALQAKGRNAAILLWGNSHADMWSGMLRRLSYQYGVKLYLNARNCRAEVYSESCSSAVYTQILKFVRDKKITEVILASTWFGDYHIPDDRLERDIRGTVRRLTEMGVKVALVIDVPGSPRLSPVTAYHLDPKAPKIGRIPYGATAAIHDKQLRLFESISKNNPRVDIIDPTAAYCWGDYCHAGRDGTLWYRDADHLTDAGADAGAQYFRPLFTHLSDSQRGATLRTSPQP